MLKAIGRVLARIWHPRGRNDEHGFHDQREAQRNRDQREASERQSEQYGGGGGWDV